jgi:uncharacterized RDD family membrane protein YckC
MRVAIVAASIVVIVAYPIVFWSLAGQTPGKAVMGLRIVRLDGKRMTVWRAVVRYVGSWLAALPLGLGFIWILLDKRRQGWHDKIAGTCVVYTWGAHPTSAAHAAMPQTPIVTTQIPPR